MAGDEFGTNTRFGCKQILYHVQIFLSTVCSLQTYIFTSFAADFGILEPHSRTFKKIVHLSEFFVKGLQGFGSAKAAACWSAHRERVSCGISSDRSQGRSAWDKMKV
jgi:hypothetical protein